MLMTGVGRSKESKGDEGRVTGSDQGNEGIFIRESERMGKRGKKG